MISRKIKITLYIILTSVFIYSLWFFDYMSTDNQTRRMLSKEIVDWYYTTTIENKGVGEPKSNEQRKMTENLTKIKYGLGDDWVLSLEDLKIKEIDADSLIIDTSITFTNKNVKETYYMISNRYYYDLNTDRPIALLEETRVIPSDKKFGETTTKTLWDGDFDAICVKPK